MEGFSVLLYHEIRKKEVFNEKKQYKINVAQNYEDILPERLFTYLEDFEWQMNYLYDNGYHILNLEEVYNYYYKDKPLPEKSVLITFDDMFVSVGKYAYPILKKYNFHAIGFVVSGWLQKEEINYNPDVAQCMSTQQLEEMIDVFEYANHTDTLHTKYFKNDRQMITALNEVSQDVFQQDLEKCEQVTTYKGVFAYPFGKYENKHIEWLKSLGYTMAFTCQVGHNTKWQSPYELRRDEVKRGITLETFKEILEGAE